MTYLPTRHRRGSTETAAVVLERERMSSRWLRSVPFSGLFKQLEREMETVVTVLQPGLLGIVEHKFSAEEIRKANATVRNAVQNWRRHAVLEKKNPFLEDYIQS